MMMPTIRAGRREGTRRRRQHRAVVIGGDQPLPIPFLEDPRRVHLARVWYLGLASEQDAGFADGDRSVVADEAKAELLVVGRFDKFDRRSGELGKESEKRLAFGLGQWVQHQTLNPINR